MGDGRPTMATGNEKEEEPKIKLRNYVPEETSNFEYTKIEAAKVQEPVEEEVAVEEDGEAANEGEDPVDLVPKKANWDLKRDVEAKLQRLERRTQNAMIELMREEEEARQEKLLKQGQ